MVAVSSAQSVATNPIELGNTSAAMQVQQYAQANLSSAMPSNTLSAANATNASPTTLGNTQGDAMLQNMQQGRQVDVINPQGMSSTERLHDNTPVGTAYGASMGSPDNLGTSLSEVLEGVHEKTTTYEQNNVSTDTKPEETILSKERDALKPTHESLASESAKTETLNDKVNSQVDRYSDMMRQGYEYYIFTSLTIDVGKDVSQTASTLTKG